MRLGLTGIADFLRNGTDRRIGFHLHGVSEEFRSHPGKYGIVESEGPSGYLAEDGTQSRSERRRRSLMCDDVGPRKPGKENGTLRMRFLRYDGESRKSEHFFRSDDGIEGTETRVVSKYAFRRNAPFHKGELHAFYFVVIQRGVVSGNQKTVDPFVLIEFRRSGNAVRKIRVRPSVGDFRGRSKHESYGVFRHGSDVGIRSSIRGDFHARIGKQGKETRDEERPLENLFSNSKDPSLRERRNADFF